MCDPQALSSPNFGGLSSGVDIVSQFGRVKSGRFGRQGKVVV